MPAESGNQVKMYPSVEPDTALTVAVVNLDCYYARVKIIAQLNSVSDLTMGHG